LPSAVQTKVAQGTSNRIVFDHLNTEDGLSYPGINDIIQDDVGFMWFATSEGLNRYDGLRFKVYKHDRRNPTTISRNHVEAIVQDNYNPDIFWIGTQHGLNKFDRRTETFTRYFHDPEEANSLIGNNIYELVQDTAGQLWIGTEGSGLDCFDPVNETFVHYRHDPDDPQSLSHNGIMTLFLDRTDTLWVATLGGGLNRFDGESGGSDPGTFTRYMPDPDDPNGFSSLPIYAIVQDQAGNLWLAAHGDGLLYFDLATGTLTRYQHDPEDPRSLSDNKTNKLLLDKDGTLWVGMRYHGLSRFDTATKTAVHYRHDPTDETSLSDNWADVLYQDRAGLIWIGTAEGVNKFDPHGQRFMLYQHDPDNANSLSSNWIGAIYEDPEGVLWIGTHRGGLNRFDPQTHTFVHYCHDPEDANSLSHDNVWAIAQDQAGRLWIGSEDQLNCFDPVSGVFKHYAHDPDNANSLSDSDVRVLRFDTRGVLWIGTWNGGLNSFDPATETFTRYPYQKGPHSLSSEEIHDIAFDAQGILWIATLNGLNRFDPATETFTQYLSDVNNPNSLGVPYVRTIYIDPAGILWLGTGGAGLNRFDPTTETFTYYMNQHGLPGLGVAHILPDDAPNGAPFGGRYLWLTCARYIVRFNPQTGTAHIYGARHGVQNAASFQMGAQLKARNGWLYFGSQAGLQAFRPDAIPINQEKPPVVLTEFRLFNRPVTPGDEGAPIDRPIEQFDALTLTHHQNDFGFEFAALSYVAPKQNKYAYKMEGYHKDWVHTDSHRAQANFTGMRPGHYVFRVRGTNDDGVWSDQEVVLPVTISQPWWQVVWFKGLPAGLIKLTVDGVCWWRNTVKRRERELQAQIAQQTAELQDSQARFRGLAEASFEALLVHNGYIVLDVNQAAMDLFGYTFEDFVGQPITALVTSDSAQIVMKNMRLNHEDPYQIEGVRQDGTVFPIEVRAKVVPYQGGKARVVAVRDISLWKTAEGALRQAKAAAEEANRAKSTFLANMSHELRTPLNGIMGFAQILMQRADLTAEQLKNVEMIYQSGQHLLTLINDVLDLARVESGKLTLYPAQVNFPLFLENICGIIRALAQEKALRFVCEHSHDLPQAIIADETRLRQVLLNLLGNAVKFTEKGQVALRIIVKQSSSPHASHSTATESLVTITFEVEDSGPGIAPEKVACIFDPFEQGATSSRVEGAGLGLAISQQLVQLMGGQIEVKSTIDQGSRFFFTLTLPRLHTWDAVRPPQAWHAATGYTGPRRSILVVDDNRDNRLVTQGMLEPLGFEVSHAESGAQGIAQAHALHPDLILMDLVMADMDGVETVNRLRQDAELQAIPIIAVSASAFKTDQAASLDAGCAAFLPKPIVAKDLLALLASLLDLDWVHAARGQVATPSEDREVSAPPAPAVLARLRELALYGNMSKLVAEIEQMVQEDVLAASFARQLRDLAEQYDDEGILALVDCYEKRSYDGELVPKKQDFGR
jgi:PAS domain S-box-containing protein